MTTTSLLDFCPAHTYPILMEGVLRDPMEVVFSKLGIRSLVYVSRTCHTLHRWTLANTRFTRLCKWIIEDSDPEYNPYFLLELEEHACVGEIELCMYIANIVSHPESTVSRQSIIAMGLAHGNHQHPGLFGSHVHSSVHQAMINGWLMCGDLEKLSAHMPVTAHLGDSNWAVYAGISGRDDVIEWLHQQQLSMRISVNFWQAAFDGACMGGHLELARRLLQLHKQSIYNTACIWNFLYEPYIGERMVKTQKKRVALCATLIFK